jgi:hypothetical protein
MSSRRHRLTSAVLLTALVVVSPPARALAGGLPCLGTFHDPHAAWHAEQDAEDEVAPAGQCCGCRDHPAPHQAAAPEPAGQPLPSLPAHSHGCAQLSFCPTSATADLGPVAGRDEPRPPDGPRLPNAFAVPLDPPPRG